MTTFENAPPVDSHREGLDSNREGVDRHMEGVDSHMEGVVDIQHRDSVVRDFTQTQNSLGRAIVVVLHKVSGTLVHGYVTLIILIDIPLFTVKFTTLVEGKTMVSMFRL